MKYHLDQRVVLNTQSPHPSLYSSFLQELGDDGQPVGRNLIPWRGNQYFEATELSLVISGGIKPDYGSDAGNAVKTHASTIISAALVPERDRRGMLLNPQTEYSMVGTDRWDVAFRLVIRPPTEDYPDPACRVWGSPAYTLDLDFRECVQPDEVVFDLTVPQAIFDRYVEMIGGSAVLSGQLQVSGVSGFYSDWSPSISTDRVKVLTADQENHPVEVPEDADFAPSRLGQVWDACFDLSQKGSLQPSTPISGDADLPEEGNVSGRFSSSRPPNNGDGDALRKLVTSLRTTVWVATVLIVLAIIFN